MKNLGGAWHRMVRSNVLNVVEHNSYLLQGAALVAVRPLIGNQCFAGADGHKGRTLQDYSMFCSTKLAASSTSS